MDLDNQDKMKLVSVLLTFTVNALNFKQFSLTVLNKMLVISDGIHQMLVRIANSEDSDQTASEESNKWLKKQSDLGLSCLSRADVCPVCLELFGRQLAFKILEHLRTLCTYWYFTPWEGGRRGYKGN